MRTSSHSVKSTSTRRVLLQSAALIALASLTDGAFAEQQETIGIQHGSEFTLENTALSARWSVDGGTLRATGLRSKATGSDLTPPTNAFSLIFADGHALTSSTMRLVDGPKIERIRADRAAVRCADGIAGEAIRARFHDPSTDLIVDWRAILRDGTAYLRQEVVISAASSDLPIRKVTLIDTNAPSASVTGTVKGSPVVAGDWFFGFEHPLSESAADGQHITCALSRELPILAHRRFACSSVIGCTVPGQMRRSFLRYIETERAHPYRPFLHYNSWFDLGIQNRYSSDQAVATVEQFGTELSTRRGVTIDSFLFDDGWDDTHSIWEFNSGFPNGFAPARRAAAQFQAAPGVWLSPWGGYQPALGVRLEKGRALGFETNARGFALSGPRYYQRFRDVCVAMIRTYGVNQFKFDGTGNVNEVIPGSAFDSDFHAMIGLIAELRDVKPDLFVNLTTGTAPSPFWLQHADSIWRGGYDTNFAGAGTDRQKWMNYRDGQTYHGVVQKGKLYPLNSLMVHGIVFARDANRLNSDPGRDFSAEVRSYFGSGTSLQELYVTPALMLPENWDVLAESAKWSRRNADILVDTHWIGGDPLNGEVYGWASWAPRGGTVTLRNPTDKAQKFDLDAGQAFELPAGTASRFLAASPWTSYDAVGGITLKAGEPTTLELQPFEVRTLQATPISKSSAF